MSKLQFRPFEVQYMATFGGINPFISPWVRPCSARGATTFSKLGVQFLGLDYCTEHNTDGITSFVHFYVKSWGDPSNFWGVRTPRPSQWLRPCVLPVFYSHRSCSLAACARYADLWAELHLGADLIGVKGYGRPVVSQLFAPRDSVQPERSW